MTETRAVPLRAVLLDVNGTLTDPAAIGAVWDQPELGDRILGRAVHTATVDALLDGSGRGFGDHLRAAIEVVVGEAGLNVALVPDAIAVAAALPARPGAAVALAALGAAGLRVVALTNSGAAAGEKTLGANGLLEHVERVLGVDAVQSFKPDPAVYRYAISELGEPAARVVLLATHPWDLAGAAHSGIRTAWVGHGKRVWPAVFPEPDVSADTLPDVASRLLNLR